MIWLAKLAIRPVDRMLALSWHILFFELDLLVQRFSVLLPSLPGRFGSLRHYAGMAVEAFFIAEAFQWLSTALVLACFWLFYFFCLPPTGTSYPFVIDWSTDVSTASALGLALQDSALVACKDIALQAIPKHVSAVELHLESSEMGSPGLYQLQLSGAGVNASEAAWRPLLPKATWAPLVALGLRDPYRAWLLLHEVADTAVDAARLCLQPPPRALNTRLHVHYKLRGLYRFVQHWPLLWSVMLVLATGCITWSMICVLLVVLLVRLRRAPGTVEPEAEVATVKTTELGALELSMSRVQEVGVHVVEAVKNPELQITAASAISGAVALGAGGGCAGLITGSVAGGACGLVPAIFTFGLSIPVGVVLGGGAGAAAGSALGSGAGAVLGTVLGRRWLRKRSEEAPETPQSKEL